MPISSRKAALLAVLFALIFLGAQLHFCADLTGAPSGTHICPVCSAIGAAVPTPTPAIAIVSHVRPLQVVAPSVSGSLEIPRATSPRAPPTNY
jgi:hypothetical protein